MSVVHCKKTRRQFLIGTGNTLLALPFLPSLFTSEAKAQMAAANDRKLMVFLTDHNMLIDYWMDKSMATNPIGSIGIKERTLSTLSSMSDISPMLTDPVFNALRMNKQITMVRGLDMQAGLGHENYSGMGGSRGDICPTFDTAIEDSPTIYPSTTPASITKALRVDLDMSNYLSVRKVGDAFQSVIPYGFDQNGYYTAVKYYTLPVMYTDVFSALTNGTTSPPDMTNDLKTNILNRVYQSYLSFKSSRKISSDDRARVDQHMGYISDLQKSLNVSFPQPGSCTKPSNPGPTLDPLLINQLYLDLLAVAFKCGLTKLGVMKFEGQDPKWLPGLVLPEGTGLHGAIHGGTTQDLWTLKRHAHTTYDRYNYNMIASRFLNSMNEPDGSTGRTYLDNMATAILPKFGMEPADGGSGHPSNDTQAMIFGTMGGRIRSDRYMHYPFTGYQGLPYNALIVTLLDLMGIPRNEYAKFSNTGRGWGIYGPNDASIYAARFYDNLPEILV